MAHKYIKVIHKWWIQDCNIDSTQTKAKKQTASILLFYKLFSDSQISICSHIHCKHSISHLALNTVRINSVCIYLNYHSDNLRLLNLKVQIHWQFSQIAFRSTCKLA